MPLGDYLLGSAFLALILGAVLATAALLVRRRLAHLEGVPRVLAFALVGTAALVAAHLAPGTLGILSRWTVAASALLLLAGAALVKRQPSGPTDPPRPPERESGALSLVLAVAVGAALALWSVATAFNRTVIPPAGVDSVTFHLPNVARWIQSGSFWQIDQFTPLLFNGNYPHTGDVVFLSILLPWRNDAFTAFVNPVFVLCAALAVYAIGLELRAPRATAVLAAAAAVSIPVVLEPAFYEAQTDAILLGTFSAGVLFLLRHSRTGRGSDLVLAGVGLGLAFGTKWYGVSSVAVVVGVWAVGSLVARRPVRRLARQGLALGGVVTAAGGFWLLRNWVESGNPLMPVKVELAGISIFDAPPDPIRECGGFTISDYATDPDVFKEHILPAWWHSFGLAGPLLAVGFLLAVAAGIRALRKREQGAGRVLALVAAAGLIALAYSVTPYSALGAEGRPVLVGANTRYVVPAMLLAAASAAWAAGRLPRFRIAFELLAAAAVVDGMRRGFQVDAKVVAGVAIGLAAAAGAGLAAWRLPPAGRAAAAGVALVAFLALGHERQRDYNDGRYEAFDAATGWVVQNARADKRIALAGSWPPSGLAPVFPAFGRRYENEVEFLGPTVDGQLREYETRASWGRALRDGGYDVLVVGRGGYGGGACAVPGAETDDDAWARAEGLRQVARTSSLTVYEVPPGG